MHVRLRYCFGATAFCFSPGNKCKYCGDEPEVEFVSVPASANHETAFGIMHHDTATRIQVLMMAAGFSQRLAA